MEKLVAACLNRIKKQIHACLITTTNNDVADLMYHAGVSVNSNYEVGTTGAWDYQDPIVKNSMNSYFRYKGTGHIAAQNSSAHNQPAQTSIRGGLPVVCGSMGHAMVIDELWLDRLE